MRIYIADANSADRHEAIKNYNRTIYLFKDTLDRARKLEVDIDSEFRTSELAGIIADSGMNPSAWAKLDWQNQAGFHSSIAEQAVRRAWIIRLDHARVIDDIIDDASIAARQNGRNAELTDREISVATRTLARQRRDDSSFTGEDTAC